jgi:hypothetical protein
MTRLERWERRTQAPLLVLALLFAAAYALPIPRPDAPADLVRAARLPGNCCGRCVSFVAQVAHLTAETALLRAEATSGRRSS